MTAAPPTIEQVIAAIPALGRRAGLARADRRRPDEREPSGGRRRGALLRPHPGAVDGAARGRSGNERHNTRAAADDRRRAAGRRTSSKRGTSSRSSGSTAGRCRTRRFGAPGMPTRIAATLRRLHAGPRFRDDFDMFRLTRALPCRSSTSATSPIPAGYRERLPGDPADRGRPRRPSAADRPLPQRPAGRELPRRRRAAVARRLRVQRQQRPDLRARQHVPGARLRRSARSRTVRGLLRRGLRRPARPDAAPDDHVRRRLDAVGGDPGAHLDRSTTTSGAGPRSAGRARRPRSTGPTSSAGWRPPSPA